MKAITTLALALCALLLAASCGSRGTEEHAHHDDEHDAVAPPGSAEEAPVLRIAGMRGIRLFTAPEPREEGAWFSGEAIGDEAAQTVLTAPVSGRVATAPTPPGRPIAQGAVLLAIDSAELADLFSHLSVANADAQRAEAALVREERLLAGGATSAREVEDARREASNAHAALESARLGFTARGLDPAAPSGRFVLRAPKDGAIVRWSVRPGQGIEARQELGVFQSAAARLVRVDLSLPGPDWHLGDETEARASDGRRWKARVVGTPALLAEDTRRLAFRLELTKGPWPLPGQPVEVRVPFAAGVIVPQTALQQIEGTWGVFVRNGDKAVFRPVHRGIELGSDVSIPDGVAPGEELVADGAYLLKSLWLKSRSGGDEHEH